MQQFITDSPWSGDDLIAVPQQDIGNRPHFQQESMLLLDESAEEKADDGYGIELIHSRRERRSEKQIGKKGLSNKRWIVGGKLGLLLNNIGLVVGWDVSTATRP